MMKFYLFVVLFLVSNITLAASDLSWLGEVWDIMGKKLAEQMLETVKFFEPDYLPFDSKRLKDDLRQSLYGQHIVSHVVLKAVTSFMSDSNPNKPLVLSFHGTTGTGKNHVAKIIARNIYKKGENSKHVHLFLPQHFPYKQYLHIYRANLKKWISGNVSSFPRSMFIFDQMDSMHSELIDILKPLLGYSAHIDGVSFRKAIFIFLSNAGGQMISKLALDFWREGKDRKEISMNIMNEKSGFLHSSIIDDLVDHYIPFLPLELEHVRQCVMTEMVHLNIKPNYDLAYIVARNMPFFPEKEKVFALTGCMAVRQKLFCIIEYHMRKSRGGRVDKTPPSEDYPP